MNKTTTNSNLYVYDAGKRRPAFIEELRELFQYKNLIIQMIRRDLVTRYKRSVLGIAWTMLNPLGMMIILSVVFSQVWDAGPGFPAYVLSGLIAWDFFRLSSSDAMTNLINGVVLRQRVYMPSAIFAITAVGNGLVNFLLSLVPLLLVMLVIGVPIHASIFFLPVPLMVLACFTLGIGLLISTIAVYFRDITAFYTIITTAWMYLNPIIYPENFLQPLLREWLIRLNPMYNMIRIIRMPIYYGSIPTWGDLLPSIIVAIVTLIIGWLVFTSQADKMAYRI